MDRLVRLLLLVLILPAAGQMGGCASMPSAKAPRESSYAYHSPNTSLARAYSKQIAAHPGQSGFMLLGSGMDALAARTALFAKAEKSIDVQYFTVRNDMAGNLFFQALLEAADRGVRVRILLDDVLVHKIESRLAVLEQHPKIEIRSFNPLSRKLPRFVQYLFQFGKYSRRMHNKSVIVDNKVTIVGSRNIGNKYAGVSPSKTNIIFSGMDVMGIGPVAELVSNSFDQFWNSRHSIRVSNLTKAANMSAREAFTGNDDKSMASRYRQFLQTSPLIRQVRDNTLRFEWGYARLIADSPDKITRKLPLDGYLKATDLKASITDTGKEMWIVSPYVVPGGADGMKFFREVRRRGVNVTIITNSYASTDNKLSNAHYAKYRKELLAMGVKIYEFKANGNGAACCHKIRRLFSRKFRAGLHAKILSFDRGETYIGSMNMDPRSVYENTELGVVISSPRLSREITDWFDRNLDGFAYQLGLRADDRLVWRDLASNIELESEPDTNALDRLWMSFLGAFPVESLL